MTQLLRSISIRSLALLGLCTLTFQVPMLIGCGGTVKQETIAVPKTAAVDEAKQILQNYANGAPITSEASGFPGLIERVKAEDAAKGAELEKGLAQIQAQPNNRASIAKSLLTKL
jgi:hypothetical protein